MNDKETIKSLKEELNRLKSAINEVGTYIYTKDLDGCYTFANSLVLELFNASLEDVIGKDDSCFFDLKRSNELRINDEQVLKYGKTVELEETNFVKKSGEKRVYLTFKKPIFDENKNIIGMCGVSNDITERKKLENELKEQKYLLNTVLNNVDAYIYMKDENRTFRYVNSRVAKLFGYDADYIIGKKDVEVMPEDVADHFWQMDKKVFDSKKTHSQEEIFHDDEGNEKHYWSVKLPYQINNESNTLIGLSTDITELQLLKEELRVLSITDDLTGAHNRRHFVKVCEDEFERCKRYDINLSIVILDIDFFKSVNDTFGHPEGDKLLIEITKLCKNLKRVEDVFFRIGGEEFAFVLPHTNIEEAKNFAQRLLEYNKNNQIKGVWNKDRNITFSIGISSYNKDDKTYDDIVHRSDNALYEAKSDGRDRICIKI